MRERTAFNPERFRVATLEECAAYGRGRGLAKRGLRAPPIAGGAGYALVGSLGAVVGSGVSSGAQSPAWGTGENRTAGNLLVAWVLGSSVIPSGWSIAWSSGYTYIYYKIAAGTDAAPTWANAWFAQLGEFSGNAASAPLGQVSVTASAGVTASPETRTTPAADVAAGELVLYCAGAIYSAAATKTLTSTLNNGATTNDVNNNATSASGHYDFGWGITTGNSAADATTFTFTTTKVNNAGTGIASFKLPAGSIQPRPVYVTNPNAMQRAATW